MRAIYLVFVAIAVPLAACGEKKVEKTVFDPQVQALKKAREVEATLQAGAEKTREAVESSTGSPQQSGY
jgi:hypothetical protein